MSQKMLRITTQEDEQAIEITLEGRIAGPWVAEISRAWRETAPRLASRKLSLDLRNVTYADALGKQALRHIHAQSNAELIVSTPWTQYLADEIRTNNLSGEVGGAER
jgi:anti-anti-sigma regulatory factor